MRSGVVLLVAALAVGGCKESANQPASQNGIPKSVSAAAKTANVVENEYGTPVKDRVATIGLLNKRNNVAQDLVLKVGESRRIGNVIVKLVSCERTEPWEQPAMTGAFVQVFVEERRTAQEQLRWNKVFSGWLFKESPSLNVVEHSVYDVWVKDCAMKFPGEEDAPAAPASSAANPAGSPRPASPPNASPRPAPSATPKAAPAPSLDI